MVHNTYEVEPRKQLTRKQRMQLFIREQGKCCICGGKIMNEEWIDEHKKPLWLDGTNDMENRGVAHVKCAKGKTADEAKVRAKIRRTAEKLGGAHRAKRPMPGSRASKWKKKMNGEVVERDR